MHKARSIKIKHMISNIERENWNQTLNNYMAHILLVKLMMKYNKR